MLGRRGGLLNLKYCLLYLGEVSGVTPQKAADDTEKMEGGRRAAESAPVRFWPLLNAKTCVQRKHTANQFVPDCRRCP